MNFAYWKLSICKNADLKCIKLIFKSLVGWPFPLKLNIWLVFTGFPESILTSRWTLSNKKLPKVIPIDIISASLWMFSVRKIHWSLKKIKFLLILRRKFFSKKSLIFDKFIWSIQDYHNCIHLWSQTVLI